MNVRMRYWIDRYRRMPLVELDAEYQRCVEAEKHACDRLSNEGDPIRKRDLQEQSKLFGERISAACVVMDERAASIVELFSEED